MASLDATSKEAWKHGFREDWYGTLELNHSVVVMTVEEKDMMCQRKQANAEGGAVVLVVVMHPPSKNKHDNL